MKTVLSLSAILIFGQLVSSSEKSRHFAQPSDQSNREESAGPSTSSQLAESEKQTSKTVQVYTADIQAGIIGSGSVSVSDDPFDNVFHVVLNNLPDGNDKVWLQYELSGLQDHTAVSRSINDRLSVGGYFVQPDAQNCTLQREQISPSWLKKEIT